MNMTREELIYSDAIEATENLRAALDKMIDRGEEREALAGMKARWQAEALESVSMQRPPGSMQREWLQEEAAKLRRQAEEEL